MVSSSTVVWIVVTTIVVVFMLFHALEESSGMWASGKKRGQIGCLGYLAVALYIVFTLIWGGIHWW